MEHIDNMDELKNGIGLRAYGQKNPVDLYRIEGGEMFDEMVAQIKLEVAKIMTHIVKQTKQVERKASVNITDAGLDRSAINSVNAFGESDVPKQNATTEKPQPIVNQGPKVGRNDPCPCGSGKKYKNCCGKNA
jgi:preprotein translocase subunit SecA